MTLQLLKHLLKDYRRMENREEPQKQKASQDYQHYLDQCLFNTSIKDISSQADSVFVEKQLHHPSPSGKTSTKFKKVQSAQTMVEEPLSDNEMPSQFKNPGGIVRVGYLSRRTDSIIRSWEKCYCVLSKSKFRCYEDKTRTVMVSCLNFRKIDSEVMKSKEGVNSFDLRWDDQVIHTFQTSSSSDLHFWIEDIQQRIKLFQKQKKLRIRQSSRLLYRDQDTLTEQEFFGIAGTGDILLMKTVDTSCAIQRLVTNSEYDHVSMVVKFGENDIKIFESNATEGVKLYDWEEFQCKFNIYQKITFRKLHHHLGQELHKHLVQFIKKTIGRRYSFSAINLLRKNSSDEGDDNSAEYFCSELIAKAYKYLKILNKSKGSNSYWPVDFTMRGAMVLQGSYLGSERVILLKKHLRNLQ